MKRRPTTFPTHLSHWEIEQFFKGIDLLVVGSGIVGLTAAIFYKRKHPHKKVLIAEKGFLPSGASTKNAGFACFGSISEILSDMQHASFDEVMELVKKRINGLSMLRDLLGDEAIGFARCGGFEVFTEQQKSTFEKCMAHLPSLNNYLKNELNLSETYADATDRSAHFRFKGIANIILNRYEGSINTGKMMTALISLARSLDIEIMNSLQVTDWEEANEGVCVSFTNGIEINVERLHFATNGFTNKLLPNLDVQPARAQVIITKPIKNLHINGTFHMDEGYYYFRNVGDRLLFGGGRNLDIQGETTSDLDLNEMIQTKLDTLLSETILPNTQFEVEHRWAGIMGVGQKKYAITKQLSDRSSCSVRLGGMGVAIGTSVGKEAADMLAST